MGSHHVNLEGDLKKFRLDSSEKVIEEINVLSKHGGEHSGHSHD